jgi:hypothetical protein
VPKVQHKPIKSPRKGSNKKSKRQPKAALVWRTALSGAPPDSVQEINFELATFGFLELPFAIIHRTVRCSTRLSGVPSGVTATTPTVDCKSEQCATARVESEQAPEGTPDSEQDLFGAPPDCPMAPVVRSSNGRTPTVG